MSYISLSRAFAQWQELAADIPKDGGPALAESWNDYTDSLCKGGELCALQRHYAPAYDGDMPGEGSRYDELRDDRAFILKQMGVTMSAEFVPHSQSRNKENEPSLNWIVQIGRNGHSVIRADYSQGRAHCPSYKTPIKFANGERDEYLTRKAVARECETGKLAQKWNGGAPTILDSKRAIPEPELTDVFYSLLSDSRVLDCRDFADWASDYGLDSDSIKHRAIYDACMADALKLRAAFGDKTMGELHDLFADM